MKYFIFLICLLLALESVQGVVKRQIPSGHRDLISPQSSHVHSTISLSQYRAQVDADPTAEAQTSGELKSSKGKAPTSDGDIYYEHYWMPGMEHDDPLVLIPGGPGYPHDVFQGLTSLAQQQPLLLFDPLATGKSDWPKNAQDIWTQDHFVQQFDELRSHLSIKSFHILGHSWGCMLAIDYYLQFKKHVSSLILASPPLNADMWRADGQKLLEQLRNSDSSLANLTDEELDAAYTDAYILEHMDATKLELGKSNPDMYASMWGTSEPVFDGTLKSYDRLADLPSIAVPTLYMCGEHDEATPETTQAYAALTPTAGDAVIIPNSGHASMLSAPEEFMNAVTVFLDEVKAKQVTVTDRMETFNSVCFEGTNPVDWSVGIIGSFMIKARLPKIFAQYRLKKQVKDIISKFPSMESSICTDDSNDMQQAVTDMMYFTSPKVAGEDALAGAYQPPQEYLDCIIDNILVPIGSKQVTDISQLLYGYVFARTFEALGFADSNPTIASARKVAEEALINASGYGDADAVPLIYCYYLTHVIIYDTVFGSIDPYTSQEEREAIVGPLFAVLPWVSSQWESSTADQARMSDLTSEIILAINWAGVNGNEYAKTHPDGDYYAKVRQLNDDYTRKTQEGLVNGVGKEQTGLCHQVTTELCATFV